MILETIITWLLTVLNGALGLLPQNGHVLDNLPYFMNADQTVTSSRSVSFSILSTIGVAEQYVPVNELGKMFALMVTTYGVLKIAEYVIAAFSLVSKIMP